MTISLYDNMHICSLLTIKIAVIILEGIFYAVYHDDLEIYISSAEASNSILGHFSYIQYHPFEPKIIVVR